MSLLHPIFILAFFCICIVVAETLVRRRFFRVMGPVLIIIILTATASNTGFIPSTSNDVPLYEGILSYVAPLSIFLLMINVKLKTIKQAGPAMLLMYTIGALATIIGVVAGFYILHPKDTIGSFAPALAGMFTGTYVGGSINFNSVALHYNITKDGNLYAAANAVDNIWTAVWIVATVVIPNLLNKLFPRRPVNKVVASLADDKLLQEKIEEEEKTNPTQLAILGALAFGSFFLAKNITALFPGIPFILLLTTIALLLGQLKAVQQLKGAKVLGMFSIYLFFAVIGAYCNLHSIISDGALALMILKWISIIILIHAIIIYTAGALLKQDWDVVSIASQAGIGGPTTALSNAKSLGRSDLQLPGVLAGTLGYAIGTYVGILVAEMLK